MAKYIVLTLPPDGGDAYRGAGGHIAYRSGGGRRAGVKAAAKKSSAGARAKLHFADLTPKEVRDNERDPRTHIARPMRTRLIAPRGRRRSSRSSDEWGISAIGADVSRFDGAGVTVAVLDTGIDARHPAFAGVSLIEQDFSGAGNGDREGHGTHCAGTIFGRDVSGVRIGVARGVNKALIAKVLDDTGSGDTNMLIEGMKWAHSKGAQVMSMSIGFDFPADVQYYVSQGFPRNIAASITLDAYRANLRLFDALLGYFESSAPFTDGGCVVAAATGNESDRDKDARYSVSVSVPAVAEGIISVGALANGRKRRVAGFSNALPRVVAPGVGIVSAAIGGGLVSSDGTSMACPHVAGAAALWWQKLDSTGALADADAVKSNLIAHASLTTIVANTPPDLCGAGLVQCP
jgi:subtilisin family serine protease